MPDPIENEPKNEEQPAENPPADEQPKDDSQQEQPAGEQPEDESNKEGEDELPTWAREKLTKANAEAANYRVKLREAEDKLKGAKTPEEIEEIVKNMTVEREATERALLVENVALKHKLPDELAELLKGSTREELEAHAKQLQKFAPADDDDEDVELEGGLSPRDRDPDAGLGPRELALKYGPRSRR